MSEMALFGPGAAALVGLGLYGFIVRPEPLRKLHRPDRARHLLARHRLRRH